MTKIEWTEQTWNPVVGCSVVSPGCTHCYAMKMAARLEAMGNPLYVGLTKPSKAGPVWTGEVRAAPDATLFAPLRRKKPTMYFVNSMSDLFHESLSDKAIDRVFAVMALCPQHTFQVLTKRSGRMREYFANDAARRVWWWLAETTSGELYDAAMFERAERFGSEHPWPLPNVWLGGSTEDQARANERIPDLLSTPAAVRFISAEPLLGPIDLIGTLARYQDTPGRQCAVPLGRRLIDWVIVGGESGHDARPMHPDWARSLRNQCAAADVPFFFKQWGEWAPGECSTRAQTRTEKTADWFDGQWIFGSQTPLQTEEGHRDDEPTLFRFGKRAAGRHLDGVLHDAMPESAR